MTPYEQRLAYGHVRTVSRIEIMSDSVKGQLADQAELAERHRIEFERGPVDAQDPPAIAPYAISGRLDPAQPAR